MQRSADTTPDKTKNFPSPSQDPKIGSAGLPGRFVCFLNYRVLPIWFFALYFPSTELHICFSCHTSTQGPWNQTFLTEAQGCFKEGKDTAFVPPNSATQGPTVGNLNPQESEANIPQGERMYSKRIP